MWEMNVQIMLLHMAYLGLISNHDIRTRWNHTSFDTITLVDACDNLDEIQVALCDARRRHTPGPQPQVRS